MQIKSNALTLRDNSLSARFDSLAPINYHLFVHLSGQSSQFLMSLKTSNLKDVRRCRAAVKDILDDLESEVAGPLHLRADGVAKKPDDDGKDRLTETEVLKHREVGSC